jgi:hypothetical protein
MTLCMKITVTYNVDNIRGMSLRHMYNVDNIRGMSLRHMGDFQKNEDFSFSENNLNIK